MDSSSWVAIVSFILGALGVGLFLFQYPRRKTTPTTSKAAAAVAATTTQPRVLQKYTKEDVAKHCKEDDAWIIVDGKVYDVTEFVPLHPGGDSILNHVGGDSTEGFKGPQHPASVWDLLLKYHIGELG